MSAIEVNNAIGQRMRVMARWCFVNWFFGWVEVDFVCFSGGAAGLL